MVKVYVCSGELKVVVSAEKPLEACLKALGNFGSGKTIDHFFYLDEQGFRNDSSAYWKVATSAVLKAGGYVQEGGENGVS